MKTFLLITALLAGSDGLLIDDVNAPKTCRTDADCPVRSVCEPVSASGERGEKRCAAFCRTDNNCGPKEECRPLRDCETVKTCPRKCYKRTNIHSGRRGPPCLLPRPGGPVLTLRSEGR